MGLIEINNPIEGALGPFRIDGAPDAGTSEIQVLTFAGTWGAGDTFTLAYGDEVTADIAWSATNNTLNTNVKNALNALDSIGANGVATATGTMTSGIGTMTVTFADKAPHDQIASDTVTPDSGSGSGDDGTVVGSTDTPGVAPSFNGAIKGALLNDVANAKLYENNGTAAQAVWGLVSGQTA